MLLLQMVPGSARHPKRDRPPGARLTALLFLLAGTVWAQPSVAARTQDAPTASRAAEPSNAALSAARQKFQKALALQTGGDWAGALTLLKEVAEVKTTPQVLFNIALCEENLGQLVAALGDYELAATDAREASLSLVETEAVERLEQLRVRIPRLRVERGKGASRASVSLGGVALGESALGKDMPVDPGTHEIRASAPGQEPFVREVRLAEGGRATVTVEFAAKQPAPVVVEEPSEGSSAQRVLGWVSGGVGLAGLSAAGVFYGLRYDAQKELDDLCPSRTACPATGREVQNRGRDYTTYGNLALGVGIAGVATAAVLWLTDRPSRDPVVQGLSKPSAAQPRHVFGLGHGSATLGATWSGTF